MNKEIQPKTKVVKFQCASCKTTFDIDSTYHADVCHIDICSNCHPWYLGKTNTASVKGKSEKLNNKFMAGKAFNDNKQPASTKKVKTTNSKKISSFNEIESEEE